MVPDPQPQRPRHVGSWDLAFGNLPARALPLSALLLFWSLSVFNLDRYPAIHEDEPWILSPGYKLFTQGVYGSDLFSGFFHIDRIYLEFQPLMAWLQGAGARLFGVGVFQMRFLPVALALLTLALTWRLAQHLAGTLSAALALFLLLFWQWSPAGQPFFGSGVPLVDLARIARYDMLVAPLGLAAFYCAICARRRDSMRLFCTAGMFTGLATLAHIYGIFWAFPILLLLAARCGVSGVTRRAAKPVIVAAAIYLSGLLLTLLPWLAVIAANFSDYAGQNFQYRDRFDLASPYFYITNLLAEPARYHLGLQDPQTFVRAGFWLLVIGLPGALLFLSLSARRPATGAQQHLLIPALTIPMLFALLISNKQYNYVAAVVPPFALVLASALAHLLRVPRPGLRILAAGILLLIGAQGALGLAHMQQAASASPSSEAVFAQLRATIPLDARVLGKPQYWLAFPGHDYRSIVLLPQLSDPHITPAPVSWAAGLAQIAPRVVLLDADLEGMFADQSTPLTRERSAAFDAYMQAHQARLIQALPDGRGGLLRIFMLSP